MPDRVEDHVGPAPVPARPTLAPPRPRRHPTADGAPRTRRRPSGSTLVLWAILVLASALRLASIRHGLPFAYNSDEELHFVPHAASAADGHLDPGYFENPAGLTYLLAIVLRVVFPTGSVAERLADDPTAVFTVARVVVALVGTLVVLVVHEAGRRYAGRAAGLVAALVLAVGFLPVFYSHQALNDVPTLLPLTLALIGSVAVYERGDLRSYVLAGVAVGLAAGIKYNAAPVALTVALAAGLRVARRQQPPAQALRLLLAAGGACLAAVVVLNPFLVLDAGTAVSQFTGQSSQAATTKLGQSGSAWLFYPHSLLWGLGLLPTVFAVVGAALMLRSDRRRAALLLAFPVLLYLYLSTQDRFFGRWFLPTYPSLAILAGHGVVRTAAWTRRRLGGTRGVRATVGRLLLPALAAVIVVPSVAAAVRNDRVLGHEDTRTLARDWILTHVAGRRIVVEPAVPADFLSGAPFELYPVPRPYQAYETTLRPQLLDTYRREGYCWVMVDSHQRDRGLAAGLAGARAYYDRLAAQSVSRTVFTPYRKGANAPAFSYDFSFDWYPRAYVRPGPYIEVDHLGDCPGRRGAAGFR